MPNVNISQPIISIKGVKDAKGMKLTKEIKPILKNIIIKDNDNNPCKTLEDAIKNKIGEQIPAFNFVKKYSIDAIRVGKKR